MAFGWAVQAVVLLAAALMTGDMRIRAGGWAVAAMSLATQLVYIAGGPDSAVEQNYGRFVLVTLIAAIYLGAFIEHTARSLETRDLAIIGANVLSVLWLSLEVYSAVWHGVATPRTQDLQFGLSGVWALYASALLAVGIYFRSRLARTLSLWLFGLTLVKMALHDLWLLDTLQRLIGFVGIGILLLTSSLLYHRFREWIFPPDAISGGA
jgi:hypothetical protein